MIDNAYAKGKNLFWGSYFQYTPTGVSLAKKAGRYFTDGSKVRRGDLAFLYYASLSRVGHVLAAYVTSVNHAGQTISVKSIEGNTSGTAYERNGGMVAVKEYVIRFSEIGGKHRIHGFARPMFGDETCTAEEFIETLEGEIGYVEKASKHQLDSKTANAGNANYTKYGEWYGSNGVAWCAQFISWCGYTACKKHLDSQKTGWEQQSDGGWKYLMHGQYIRDSWKQISGQNGNRWYVFDGSGNMVTGWMQSDDLWYYLNPDDGAMLSGQWLEEDGLWYYLTKSGEMAVNTYIRSEKTAHAYHWVDGNGRWTQKVSGTPDLYTFGIAD